MSNFADELILSVRAKGHPLCVGLDPNLDLLPNIFRSRGHASPRVNDVKNFVFHLIDRVHERVAVVKAQSAFYERLGSTGMVLLAQVIAYARSKGLLVILDAKRNDIGPTATAYAQAYLGAMTDLDVDALTVNPYLGSEGIEPFSDECVRCDKGIFVLAKTSNVSAFEIQDATGLSGKRVYEAVSEMILPFVRKSIGPKTGWSSIGVVVGATQPADALRIRDLLPDSLFLVPGYGSQGASATQALSGFVRVNGCLEGGIVNSSRAIMFPTDDRDVSPHTWDLLVEQSISQSTDDLSAAVRR